MTARCHLEKAVLAAGVTFRGFHPGRKYAGTRFLQKVKGFGRVGAQLDTDHFTAELVAW